MISFEFTVKDPMGLHARPAARLVKEAARYASRIVLEANGKTVEATRLMALMGMRVKAGAVVKVTVSGEDEVACTEGLRAFFAESLQGAG